jgi:capsule polysaccharide export protein KpsE/RkpR
VDRLEKIVSTYAKNSDMSKCGKIATEVRKVQQQLKKADDKVKQFNSREGAARRHRAAALQCGLTAAFGDGLLRRRALQHGADRLRARVAHLEGVRAVCAALALRRQLDQVVRRSV